MRYGVREVCNIAFKAKAPMTLGSKTFKKGETVIFFDSAKTSAMEGSSTSVYAQGGRGNPKLITWIGEKSMTFSFEDALISPISMSILMGANIVETASYLHHVVLDVVAEAPNELKVADSLKANYGEDFTAKLQAEDLFVYAVEDNGDLGAAVNAPTVDTNNKITVTAGIAKDKKYRVDGYVKATGTQLTITPDKFSDAFYIEAEGLFRRESDGVDSPSQITIPNGRVQSSFTLTMANSGDPSTFSFTVDAVADYTKSSKTKKALAEINILG
jgi:hypothetical protein|nr:MAG TPA: structural protein [Caudoviricetes sp.]